MVLRHAHAPYSDFVLLFHMAIFFVASGYLYKCSIANSAETVKLFFFKKIRSLYMPYFIYTVIFILLNNFFLLTNIYTDNPAFLETGNSEIDNPVLGTYLTFGTLIKQIAKVSVFQGVAQIGGALWFFQTMFLVLIGYTLAEFFVRRVTTDENIQKIIQTVISMVLLLIGYWCQNTNHSLKGLDRVCSVYILIHIGVLLNHYSLMQKARLYCNQWIILFIALSILLIGYQNGCIALSENNIENPFFYITMSLAGWFLLYSIAELLIENNFKLNRRIVYLSIHSVPIIALHFLCFKIISALAVTIYGMEKYMIAAFPVLILPGFWWIAYTVVGLFVPLFLRNIVMANISKFKEEHGRIKF